jgi:hypothetical protein
MSETKAAMTLLPRLLVPAPVDHRQLVGRHAGGPRRMTMIIDGSGQDWASWVV